MSQKTDIPGPVRQRWVSCVIACLAIVMMARSHAEPVLLTDQHVDVAITYDETVTDFPLGLGIHLEDEELEFEVDEAILVVNESAEYILPDGTPFGEAGESLWILPQSPRPDLLYVGLSGEELPEGVFEGSVEMRLIEVAGPGDFYLWQTDTSGNLQIRMNSRDGIDATDSVAPLIGGHDHANWGFSQPGVFTVTFQVSGRRLGESTNVVSEPMALTFHVLPLPDEPETPFEIWQREEFGEDASELVKGPGEDPDGDGLENIAEYAFGQDPLDSESAGAPVFALFVTDEGTFGGVRVLQAVSASDVEVVVEAALEVDSPVWEMLQPVTAGVSDNLETLEFVDTVPVTEESQRFYRIGLRFK